MEIKDYNSTNYISSDINIRKFEDIDTLKRGLVILGTGGQLKVWVEGIKNELINSKIFNNNDWIEEYYLLMTKKGRADLFFIFKDDISFNPILLKNWIINSKHSIYLIIDYIELYKDQHLNNEEE